MRRFAGFLLVYSILIIPAVAQRGGRGFRGGTRDFVGPGYRGGFVYLDGGCLKGRERSDIGVSFRRPMQPAGCVNSEASQCAVESKCRKESSTQWTLASMVDSQRGDWL